MKQDIESGIIKIVEDLHGSKVDVELTRPDAQFGDFSTNVALKLGKQLGRNPRELAEEICHHVKGLSSHITGAEVAGPGFINLTLSDEALLASLTAKPSKNLTGKRYIVEYSDPNPFKPLHAGHLYTTLVGDTLSRLIENAGAETIRLNYGGDVGLHVGRSMWSIMRWLGDDPAKLDEVDDLPRWMGERYVEGTSAYEGDEAAKAQIIAMNKRVYEIQNTNDYESADARVYWRLRDWSYTYFKSLYEQLQVKPFDRYLPESEVTPLGLQTVREQLEKGVYTESDGAVVFRGEEHGLHTRVFINREGIPTYEAKDVGLSLTKWRDYHFDKSIIITANEQEQYMKVVVASIAQFAPEPAERTLHINHGVVKLGGGVKMSSRKGNILSAMEILDAARAAAKQSQAESTEENMLAAVKYAFAKARIGGDIVFDPNESIALEGNSGPYLQYAHARARSILAKIGSNSGELVGDLDAGERILARKLSEYSESVEKATKELMPHHVCTYLYELAQEFNRFYEKNRVVGDPRSHIRTGLVRVYADTLKNGLGLLGIHAPDKM